MISVIPTRMAHLCADTGYEDSLTVLNAELLSLMPVQQAVNIVVVTKK